MASNKKSGRTMRRWHGNSEIRRFRAFPAMIAVVLLIPMFYCGAFLWSMWEPAENVNNMKVAVVNEDKGATMPAVGGQDSGEGGEPLDAGQRIIDNLHDNDNVDWQFVNADDAASGLREGTYFATVTIPENFSTSVTTIGTEAPEKAQLQILYNDATGATAKTILDIVVTNLRDTISSNISAQAADKIFVSINTISEGVGKAADGSKQVNDGAQQLNNSVRDELAPGASELQNKVTNELAPGASELQNKVTNELAPGAQQLSDGINNQLAPGTTKLRDSVRDELAPGATSLADGNRQLSDGLQELNDKIAPLRNNHVAMQIPEVRDLVNGVGQLTDGAVQAKDGAQKLSNGINNDLLTGVEDLNRSVNTELAPGATKLADGINNQLVPGVDKLADGINGKLLDGTGRLADGSNELNDGLQDAAKQIPQYDDQQAQDNANVIADPVGVDEEWMYQQSSNGQGMAPYFAALALFIGALFTWQALRPLSGRALTGRVSAIGAMMHSLWPAWLLAFTQAMIMTVISIIGFNLPAERWLPTMAVLVLAALSFTSLQQTFAIWAGNAPGRLLSIIFLLLNLVSAGGTYPLQTLPDALRHLGPALPFYHIVQALRESLIGGLGTDYWSAIGYFVVFLTLSLVAGVFGASARRVFTIGKLRPAIPSSV